MYDSQAPDRDLPRQVRGHQSLLQNKKREMPVPFVLYVDFESFLVPVEDSDKPHSSDACDVHEPSGFCVYRVSQWPEYDKSPYVFSNAKSSNDLMEHFYSYMMQERNEIARILGKYAPMVDLTPDQQVEFDQTEVCFSCHKEFSDGNRRVKHHDHVSGLFLAACCNSCNLQLKWAKQRRNHPFGDLDYEEAMAMEDVFDDVAGEMPKKKEDDFFIPVFAHNMKRYDAHLIIKYFQRKYIEHKDKNGKSRYEEVKVIATNTEQFISFNIGKLRFLDSFQFLTSSLDNLSSVLLKSGRDKFSHTHKHTDGSDLTYDKGHYPYEFMTDRTKFDLTALPPKDAFTVS